MEMPDVLDLSALDNAEVETPLENEMPDASQHVSSFPASLAIAILKDRSTVDFGKRNTSLRALRHWCITSMVAAPGEEVPISKVVQKYEELGYYHTVHSLDSTASERYWMLINDEMVHLVDVAGYGRGRTAAPRSVRDLTQHFEESRPVTVAWDLLPSKDITMLGRELYLQILNAIGVVDEDGGLSISRKALHLLTGYPPVVQWAFEKKGGVVNRRNFALPYDPLEAQGRKTTNYAQMYAPNWRPGAGTEIRSTKMLALKENSCTYADSVPAAAGYFDTGRMAPERGERNAPRQTFNAWNLPKNAASYISSVLDKGHKIFIFLGEETHETLGVIGIYWLLDPQKFSYNLSFVHWCLNFASNMKLAYRTFMASRHSTAVLS